MNSRHLLNEHPSVQDLQMQSKGMNPNKFMHHQYVINSGPLINDVETRSALNAKKVAKDQSVKVIRNEENIRKAQVEMQKALKAAKKPAVASKSAADKLPALPPRSGSSLGAKHKKQKSGDSSPTTVRSRDEYPYNDPAAYEKYKRDKKNLQMLKAKTLTGGKAPSLVSTVFSFDADSDDDSFSMYSCSCCHVEKASTVSSSKDSKCSSAASTNYSAYENMTSVSQRTPNPASSVGSRASRASGTSKIRKLEAELHQERNDRQKTMKDLEEIQKRQALLLSKLSEDERAQLAQVMKK